MPSKKNMMKKNLENLHLKESLLIKSQVLFEEI